MFNFKRKTDWINGLNTGLIGRNETVTLWVLPHGALCEVGKHDTVPFLRNGVYNALGAPIAEMLLDSGVEGRIIVCNEKQLPQGMSHWLTWWLSQVPFEEQIRLWSLKITTFGKQPTKALPFQTETISPMRIESGAALSMISAKSRASSVSQFIIERDNGETYRLEPHRSITAKVLDVTPHGFVLLANQGGVFATHHVHRSVHRELLRNGLKPEDLIGTDVTVHYTMFTQGSRLNNFKSPVVSRANSVGQVDTTEDDDWATPVVDTSKPLFQAPAWAQCSGMLTLRHCLDAHTTIDNEKTTIMAHDATDPNRLLFRFVKGAVPGHYVAQMADVDGQLEDWTFEPHATADILNPDRFVEAMERQLYFATGLSIRGLGLCYTDRMRQLETA